MVTCNLLCWPHLLCTLLLLCRPDQSDQKRKKRTKGTLMIVNLVPANQVAWHEEKMKRAFFFLPSSLSLFWEFDRCPKLLHFDASYFGVMRYLIELFACSPMLHVMALPLLKAMAYSPSSAYSDEAETDPTTGSQHSEQAFFQESLVLKLNACEDHCLALTLNFLFHWRIRVDL